MLSWLLRRSGARFRGLRASSQLAKRSLSGSAMHVFRGCGRIDPCSSRKKRLCAKNRDLWTSGHFRPPFPQAPELGFFVSGQTLKRKRCTKSGTLDESGIHNPRFHAQKAHFSARESITLDFVQNPEGRSLRLQKRKQENARDGGIPAETQKEGARRTEKEGGGRAERGGGNQNAPSLPRKSQCCRAL